MTSLEPLAAKICSGPTPWCRASAVRNRLASRSGYRCHDVEASAAATCGLELGRRRLG